MNHLPLRLAPLLVLPLLGLASAPSAPRPTPSALQGELEFPAASPAATVTQRIGMTDVELAYSRPSRKGRSVFGSLVPFGEVWRCGANSATKLTFSTPVTFGTTQVPAGSYALFAVPDVDEWTLILNSVPGQWGAYNHDPSKDVAKASAKPTTLAQPVETLALGFSDLGPDSAQLFVEWESMRVAVPIRVDLVAQMLPRIQAALAADGKKPWFQAAMFYFDNGLDLKQALAWMDAGLAEQPQTFWMLYRKGLIQEKAGDKAGARASAEKSLEMAKKAEGEIRGEYVALNEALLARLR